MRHPTNQQKKRFGYTVFALLLLGNNALTGFRSKNQRKAYNHSRQ